MCVRDLASGDELPPRNAPGELVVVTGLLRCCPSLLARAWRRYAVGESLGKGGGGREDYGGALLLLQQLGVSIFCFACLFLSDVQCWYALLRFLGVL